MVHDRMNSYTGSMASQISPEQEAIAFSAPFPDLDDTVAYGRSEPDRRPADDSTVSDLPEEDCLVGVTLGQYRLDELVGKGSMGRVYRAEHLGLHRPCAIKIMNRQMVEREPHVLDRFWEEARAVANVLHPNVVTIHNLGSAEGFHFIEMEYVPGGVSLRELIIREGRLETLRAAQLVRQVVLALQAAHRSGLVHRDVKPANVLLDQHSQAKLADFGLVRRIHELDRSGVPVAGTPSYMAPELFEGTPASHRSDIYAVGVMLYYLLSARLPFTSDQIGQLIKRHRYDPVPDIQTIVPSIPESVSPILEKCLAKRPDDRYQSAEALAADLQQLIRRVRDTETLVRESVAGLDCFVQGNLDLFRIIFHLPSDRLQEVYLEASNNSSGERLLSVFSVCAPAEPKHFEFALRLNDKLAHGSISVRNVNGQAMFIMNRTFSVEHACPSDVRAALIEIARRSDRVEQQLTNADLY